MIDSRKVKGDLVGLLQGCDIPIPWGAAHLDSVRETGSSAWEDVWVNIWAAFGCCCCTDQLSWRREEVALVSQALQ